MELSRLTSKAEVSNEFSNHFSSDKHDWIYFIGGKGKTLSKPLLLIVINYENLTYERIQQYTIIKKRKCLWFGFLGKCIERIVKVKRSLTKEEDEIIEKGIKAYLFTQVYGDILKNL